MSRLHNRVAIVTGAAGGLGESIAQLFAQEGGLVLATDIQFAPFHIRVNSIHPGGVLTPMTEHLFPADPAEREAMMKAMCPMGRIGEAIEIAYGALFLASNESAYMTGSEMVIDGGMTAR